MSRIFAFLIFLFLILPMASSASAENLCSQGVDCYSQALGPESCVGANGFLNQVNILSLINKGESSFSATLKYRDSQGVLRGEASLNLEPATKRDIIINDLGLLQDTIGTICVSTTAAAGSWQGGITIYKQPEDASFGSEFDYALHYPLLNPSVGRTTSPLNTFHLGVPADYFVANWISISDVEPEDGQAITGRIDYFSAQGSFLGAQSVAIPNGGRMDFDAHSVLAGPNNIDAIGSARFSPNLLGNGGQAKFNFTTTRYFYDCPNLSCSDFRTAFVVPRAGKQNAQQFGRLSDTKGEASVIELVNPSLESSEFSLLVQNALGTQTGELTSSVSNLGSRHLLFNDQSLGTLNMNSGDAGAITVFYKLDDFGNLLHAHASPLLDTSATSLHSQFNSFLGAANTAEFFNSSGATASINLQAISFNGQTVLDDILEVKAGERLRFVLPLPIDSYGILRVESDTQGVQFLNTLTREESFTLVYPGL
jgi:hypothetical protein